MWHMYVQGTTELWGARQRTPYLRTTMTTRVLPHRDTPEARLNITEAHARRDCGRPISTRIVNSRSGWSCSGHTFVLTMLSTPRN